MVERELLGRSFKAHYVVGDAVVPWMELSVLGLQDGDGGGGGDGMSWGRLHQNLEKTQRRWGEKLDFV